MDNTQLCKGALVVCVIVGGARFIAKIADLYEQHSPEIKSVLLPLLDNFKKLFSKSNTSLEVIS